MRRFLIGLAGGFGAGYLAVRAVQAVRDVRNPAPPLEKDPQSYGSLRRKLMLVGIARSLAELAFVAYGPAASLAPRDGSPEPRKRRVALLGAALVASTLFDLPAAYLEGPAIERRYCSKASRAPSNGSRNPGRTSRLLPHFRCSYSPT
jgi:hypothetical protein